MIVCVRQGDVYGPEYVRAMSNMIAAVDKNETLVVLTDRPDVQTRHKTTFKPLTEGLEGWWAKMELFAPWNADLRPFLYVDLDCFVLDTLDGFKNRETLHMVEEFNESRRDWESNSSLMWVPDSEDVDTIWRHFAFDRPDQRKNFRGSDQTFISRYPHDNFTIEDGVYSYKFDKIQQTRPYDGKVVAFHGRPKPPDTEGWAKRMWDTYKV